MLAVRPDVSNLGDARHAPDAKVIRLAVRKAPSNGAGSEASSCPAPSSLATEILRVPLWMARIEGVRMVKRLVGVPSEPPAGHPGRRPSPGPGNEYRWQRCPRRPADRRDDRGEGPQPDR